MTAAPIILIFFSALIVTVYRGSAMALATVYLGTLLCFFNVPPLPLPFIPDMTAGGAAVYGMVLGILIKGGEPFPIRWNLIDLIIVLLIAQTVLSAMFSEYLWTGVSTGGAMVLTWGAPYVLARKAFGDADARRSALWTVLLCSFVMALFAPIEMRMWPHFFERVRNLCFGFGYSSELYAWRRFGFFRARLGFAHPIYLGNAALVMMGLICLMAGTTRIGMRNRWVLWALVAAVVVLISSLSFGPYSGLMVGAVAYFVMTRWRLIRVSLVPVVVITLMLALLMTFVMLQVPTTDTFAKGGGTLETSFRVRALIVQNSWKMATTASLLGAGRMITQEELDLESVDNAYLLFTMQRGWMFLLLWLTLPLLLAHRASRAMRLDRPGAVFPICSAMAAIFGLFAAIYTVWASSDFMSLWMLLLGYTVTAIDTALNVNPPLQLAGFQTRAPTRSAPPPLAAHGAASRIAMN